MYLPLGREVDVRYLRALRYYLPSDDEIARPGSNCLGVEWEWGMLVAPSTILPLSSALRFSRLWHQCERPVSESWRCDDAYVSLGCRWMDLYRAAGEGGGTVDAVAKDSSVERVSSN